MEEQNKLESWDSFTLGKYFKAEDLKDKNTPYVCVRVEIEEMQRDSGEAVNMLVLTIQSNETETKFSVNKTNAKFLSTQIDKPRDLIGKKIYFEKIKTRNPRENKIIDSLVIWKIE